MFARIWQGEATGENAEAYRHHVTRSVFPSLRAIPGHRGAWLLRREEGERVTFVVMTLWNSMKRSGSSQVTTQSVLSSSPRPGPFCSRSTSGCGTTTSCTTEARTRKRRRGMSTRRTSTSKGDPFLGALSGRACPIYSSR